jgi:hypothetical protein
VHECHLNQGIAIFWCVGAPVFVVFVAQVTRATGGFVCPHGKSLIARRDFLRPLPATAGALLARDGSHMKNNGCIAGRKKEESTAPAGEC